MLVGLAVSMLPSGVLLGEIPIHGTSCGTQISVRPFPSPLQFRLRQYIDCFDEYSLGIA